MVDHLIDISSYNPVNDWAAVARDGITGVSVKISQATDYLNPLRAAQVNGARANGIAPGGYHFGDHRYDARAQARYFVQHSAALGLFSPDALAPMYDVENWTSSAGEIRWQSRQQVADHLGMWLDVLDEDTDVKRALVYGSRSWWGGTLVPEDWQHGGIEVLNWIAIFNGDPGNLQGWDHPDDALHQHTSNGIVPGIPGRVDKNMTLRGRSTGNLLAGGSGATIGAEVTGVEVWTTRLKSGLGYTATAEEWVTETSARAERIEVQLASLAGALSVGQTAILAAIGTVPDSGTGLSDEEVLEIAARVGGQLLATLPAAVVLAIGHGLIDRPVSEVG